MPSERAARAFRKPTNDVSLLSGGVTVWLTGLPGAGKSTIAQIVQSKLHSLGISSEWLDGDAVRRELSPDLGFSKQERALNISRIAYIANLLTRHGVVVLVSVVSPYRALRESARSKIGRFIEVFVNAPLEECERRDPKGLFHMARLGKIKNFTGISDIYEPPTEPTIECQTDKETDEESAAKIVAFLKRQGIIRTLGGLTGREKEVLLLLGRGFVTKEIAEILGTSTTTIGNHRKHICQKLNVHSTAELVYAAANSRVMSCENSK